MKHQLLILLAFALFSPTLFAQWTQTAGPEGGTVYCVEQVGDELWAGTQGGLYISTDEGDSWQLSPDIPAIDYVSHILVHGDTVIMLVSQFNLYENDYEINVFVRTAPGNDWSKHSTPVLYWDGFATILFLNDFGLFVAGSGILSRSTDLGVSWNPVVYPPGINYTQSITNDGNRIFIDADIYNTAWVDYNVYSTDGGATWQTMPAFPPDVSYDQIFVENDLILLAGYDTLLYRSTDFGATWQTVPVQNYHVNLRRGDDGLLYALSNRLCRSTDDGLTWTYGPTTSFNFGITDFASRSDGSFVMATPKGVYSVGSDLSDWSVSNTGLRATQVRYQFISPEGYVYVSTPDDFFVSKNAGTSWQTVLPDSLAADRYVLEMLFLGDTLVGANGNAVLFSFDHGQTWSKMTPAWSSGSLPSIQSLGYFENTLYAVGNRFFKTSDWGQTWTESTMPGSWINNTCNDLKFLNGQLFAAFGDGKIMQSLDSGNTWVQLTDLSTYARLEYMNGALFALGGGNSQYSTDNGNTWQELKKYGLPVSGPWDNPPQIINLNSLGNLIFAALPWNGVWFTDNFGASWTPYNEGLGNLRSYNLAFADSFLYLGTSTGGVWRRANSFKSFSGMVYNDLNNNGTQDPGELPYQGAIVSAQPLSSYNTTSANGGYTIYAEAFNDTVRVTALTPYAIVMPPYYLVTEDADSLDFGIYTMPDIVDLCVTVTHIEPIRPGFDNSFVITVKNVGTTTASGMVRMGLPDGITYDWASPLPDQILNDTLHWDVVNLEPGAFVNYTVNVTASAALTLGSTVSYAAEVQPFDDENPINNNSNERTEVVGSYDPNDKAVTPGPWLTPEALEAGEPLTYTIRFENTGTYFAEFIRITDTLSPLIDASTLQILSSSHPCTWTLKGPGIVEFFFSDIQLPWYEPDKHGFVKFSVQPKRNLELGDLVENTAFIYFDFNPAIVTNTVGTTVGYPTATGEPKYDETLQLFPNPVYTDELVLVLWPKGPKGDVFIDFYDTNGRIVQHQKATFTNDFVRLPLENLSAGGYILLMRSNDRSAKGKMIVLRR